MYVHVVFGEKVVCLDDFFFFFFLFFLILVIILMWICLLMF
jgi:hypothetical protein